MHILFAANELHFPDNMGGSRMDVHDLAIALQEQGHQVAVLAILRGRNRLLGYRAIETLTGRCVLYRLDTRNGYETFRCGSWQIQRFLRAAIARDVPDLLIAQGPGGALLARAAARRGVPAVMRLTSAAETELLAGEARADPRIDRTIRDPLVTVVAVSRFVATLAKDQMDISPAVIYPPVRLPRCTTQDRRPEHITFVNPIPMKGLGLALRVADLLPHRQFLFVEAWNMRGDERAALDREVSRRQNVSFQPRSPGLASVYRSTALLLVPSQCPEAFSRVVLEACANGIPVVASRTGGLPEAMGESGVLLDAGDAAGRWADAIEGILTDHARQRHFAATARVNAQRDELGLPFVVAQYLSLVDGPSTAAVPGRMGTATGPK
jgi:glycosyltransferase involved in cell wall biosynthesis